MSRAERARKRNKADWHFLRLTAYWTGTFVGTVFAHLAGDAMRGFHGYGGDMLLPFAAVLLFYMHNVREEQRHGTSGNC